MLAIGADQPPTRPTPSSVERKVPTIDEVDGKLLEAELEIEILKLGIDQAEVSLILPSLDLS